MEDAGCSRKCVIIASLALVVTCTWLAAAQFTPSVRWFVTEDVSDGWDAGFAACVSGDYVYVVGYSSAEGGKEFRVEMRDRASGDLVRAWILNPSEGRDMLGDCLVAGGRLYVVGTDERPGNPEWVILVFDLDLNLLANVTSNPTDEMDQALSVTSDGEYLYIAGSASTRWRIEKRRLEDLSLVEVRTLEPGEHPTYIRSIAINPATSELWGVGMTIAESRASWYIVILDRDLERVRMVAPGIEGAASSVAFDEEGYAYVVGEGAVAKFDEQGEVIKVDRRYNGTKALYWGGHLYAASATAPVITGEGRRILPRLRLLVFDKNLSQVEEIALGEERGYFPVGKMGFDGESLYIAGLYEASEGNAGWIIFSVAIAPPRAACPWRIEDMKIASTRVTFGEPLEIEVSLSRSGLLLTVTAFNRELGEEFVLFNSTAESKVVKVAGRGLPAGNYTITAYPGGRPECGFKPLEAEVVKSRPRITLTASREEVEVGEEVLVEGRVEGFAERIYVNLTSPAGEVRTGEVKLEDSSFTIKLKLEEPGAWKIVAYAPETLNTYASTSNIVTIQARERAGGWPPITIAVAAIAVLIALALLLMLLKRRRR